jgi:hypothetical protein
MLYHYLVPLITSGNESIEENEEGTSINIAEEDS